MITSRMELINYCLRKLGAPVLHINVAPEQIEDRINDAIQYFQEYHSEATQRTLLKHKLSASHILLTTNTANTFQKGEIVRGQISGAYLTVFDTPELNKIRTEIINGTPIDGEVLIGEISGSIATLANKGVYIGDIQKRSVPVPDSVIAISKVFPISGSAMTMDYLFDVRYQLMLNDVFNLNQNGLQYYNTVQSHISLLEFLLKIPTHTTFNRRTGEIKIDSDWTNLVQPDDYVVVEAYVTIDPQEYTKVYDDIFLKRYSTALIKMQWAQNLSKFQDIEMIGGVKLNASQMMTEAAAEIKDLEDNVINRFSEPLGFMMG